MKADALQNQLRDYLLGTLPESEQTVLEQALLNDRKKFDEARAVETDLVDRYVRNRLSANERTQFERHYLASPLHRERVAIAEAMLAEFDLSPAIAEPSSSWWPSWQNSFRFPQLIFNGAMAVVLLLTAGVAFWLFRDRAQLNQQVAQLREQSRAETERRQQELAEQQRQLTEEQARSQQLRAELDKLQQQKEPIAVSAVLSFLLTPATRAANNSPTVIPRKSRNTQLLIELDGARYPSYQARLQTVEGRAVSDLPVRATKDGAFAVVALPLAVTQRGDYVLILNGRKASGDTEELDRYFFRIQ